MFAKVYGGKGVAFLKIKYRSEACYQTIICPTRAFDPCSGIHRQEKALAAAQENLFIEEAVATLKVFHESKIMCDIHFFQDGTSRDSGSCKMCPLHAKVCLWKRCLRKGVGQILIFLPPSKMLKHLPLKMCVSFVSKRQQSRNRKKKASQRRKLEKPMRHWCCQLRKEGRD